MPHDISLIKHTHACLRLYDGRPITLEGVTTDVELASARKLDVGQVKASLLFLQEAGCVSKRVDQFQREVWTITETGKSTSF